MAQILNYLLTGVVLVVMFSLLVAAHELGHYLFARLFNMGVEEFAIGFGKPQWLTWMRRTYLVPMRPGEVSDIKHESDSSIDSESSARLPEDIRVVDTPSGQVLEETTRFTFRAWPFGGFVRIKGMVPEEDGSETTIAGGFYSKPPWQRFIVLLAGPAFSVITGMAILIPLFLVEGTSKYGDKPIIGQVSVDGPAYKAGLLEGDIVKSIEGKPISTFYEMNVIVRDSAGKKLAFVVSRAGKDLDIGVTPELEDTPSQILDSTMTPTSQTRRQGKLKTSIPVVRERVGFAGAAAMAISVPIGAVDNLIGIIRHPSRFPAQVSGPITIGRVTSDRVKLGLPAILELAALLSISVGVFNLLPVAPMDGGLMMMALAEILRRGKRLSIRVQGTFNMVGLACMAVLIVCVFCVDVSRLFNSSDSPKDPPAQKAAR